MEQGERATMPARRLVVSAIAVVTVAAVAVTTWWFTAVHPGMHLAESAGVTVCFAPVTVSGTELVVGGLDFSPPSRATILAVRLVEPQNIELADTRVVPVLPDAGPGLGAATGWPIGDRDQYGLDWAADRELVGAHLKPGVTEMPYLHLHVVDPTQSASFDAWQVEYKMRATRWSSTFPKRIEVPLEQSACGDD